MSSALLEQVLEDGILLLSLDRPKVLNAIDRELREALTARLSAAATDAAVRGVVLTGTGERAFTAGQDLSELAELDEAGGRAWIRSLGALYTSIRGLDVPCVVALNGLASGAGLQMALHADYAVGHDGVRMGQPEINAGLPSVLGPWVMRQTMGLTMTQALSLTARLVDAGRCHRLGAISELVPAGGVLPAALEAVRRMAALPAAAFAATKQRARELSQPAWQNTLEFGEGHVAKAFANGQPQQVAKAFLARSRN